MPCSAAAVFTRNKFQAAPVIFSRETLQKRSGEGIRAIIINSGCANAVTGKRGLEDAAHMATTVDEQLHPTSDLSSSTLVMSTGVIGYVLFRIPLSMFEQKYELHSNLAGAFCMSSGSSSTSIRQR